MMPVLGFNPAVGVVGTRRHSRSADATMSNPTGGSRISLDSVVAVVPDQVSSDLGDEVVILDLESGQYHGVTDVGVRMWQLVQDPIRVRDIRDRILEEYDVDASRCERDVIEFLGQLLERGLVEIRG